MIWTTYRPREIAQVTPFSPVRQRDLRRRGLMPFHEAGGGWTRSDAFQVAAMVTMEIAADVGIPLQSAKAIGEIAADHVVYLAAQTLGDEAAQFADAQIGIAQRFLVLAPSGLPQLTNDIGAFFDGSLTASLVIDLRAVAATLNQRTKHKPIVSR